MNKRSIKAGITRALRRFVSAKRGQVTSLIPSDVTYGKLYEAHVLSLVCERLVTAERCSLQLVGGSKITLKSSPGPINANYPSIRVLKGGVHFATIWTDVEFTSLSCCLAGGPASDAGDYHELDLLLVQPGVTGRPLPYEILLGVECKNTSYKKRLLREILGVRRELSYLREPCPTQFNTWPRSFVPASPPSCLAVFSTDPAIINFTNPGIQFGVDFYHEPI